MVPLYAKKQMEELMSATGGLKRMLQYLWRRKALLLGYLVIFAVGVWVSLEIFGSVNYIPGSGNSEIQDIARVTGAFGSLALSFVLLLFYAKQTSIQEYDFKPYLTGEVDSLNIVSSQFVVRNSGEGYAYDVDARWEVADYETEWQIPSLAPGEKFGFPVIVDDDNWILSTESIKEYLSENGDSTEITYTIWCKDRFGVSRKFSNSVDFEVMAKRAESHEIWEEDPTERMASSLSGIDDSLGNLESEIDDLEDYEERRERTSINNSIVHFVESTGEIDKDVLKRLLGVRHSLEYRLSELEEAGLLEYNERTGKIRDAPSPGDNHTLDDFS